METKFISPEPMPCQDCGEPHTEFYGSIAGWLCAGCYQRFTDAARGLLDACQRRAAARKAAR